MPPLLKFARNMMAKTHILNSNVFDDECEPFFRQIDHPILKKSSNDHLLARFPNNGPVIKVEDTGCQVNVSLNRLSPASSALNSVQSSIDKVENGGVHNGGVHFPAAIKAPSRPHSSCLRRNNSR